MTISVPPYHFLTTHQLKTPSVSLEMVSKLPRQKLPKCNPSPLDLCYDNPIVLSLYLGAFVQNSSPSFLSLCLRGKNAFVFALFGGCSRCNRCNSTTPTTRQTYPSHPRRSAASPALPRRPVWHFSANLPDSRLQFQREIVTTVT